MRSEKPVHVMDEDRSKRLDDVPAQFTVIVTRHPKYGKRSEDPTSSAASHVGMMRGDQHRSI